MAVDALYSPIAQRASQAPTLSHPFWSRHISLATVIFLGDLLITLAPCLFLVLAVEAVLADESNSADWGRAVKEAAKVSPTIFPVVFAAIVGRLMRSLALWHAERGASLGMLEQMSGSQNLVAALERFVLLPGVSYWSYFIALLWMLSPIGGQSSMRVNTSAQVSSLNTTTVFYFNNAGDGVNSVFAGTGISSMKETTLNGVLHSCMLSLRRSKQHDMWGNVKIPFLHHTEAYANGKQDDEWYAFSQASYQAQHSAMTGVVISGLKNEMDTQFTMQSSYFNVTCPQPRYFPMDKSTNGTARYGGFVEWAGDLLVQKNLSQDLFTFMVGNNAVWNSYLIETNWGTPSCESDGPFSIVFASQGARQIEIAGYKCTVNRVAVESDVLCKNTDCQVRRIRPSQTNSSINDLPFPAQNSSIPANMFKWLSSATWISDKSLVSPIDWYISGSDTPFPRVDMSDLQGLDVSYRNVSTDTVAQRLASLINTGYQASHQLSALTQPASENATALSLSLNPSTASLGLGYTVVAAIATTVSIQTRYVASTMWVGITIIVALILLLCGIFGMVLKYGVQCPDILGYVSSMTRDNPSFEYVASGDRLDGLERARQLRHLKVQIVDTRPLDEQGNVTLRYMDYNTYEPSEKTMSHVSIEKISL